MGITSQEAIDLLDGISSKEELTALIEQLDTTGNGKSTTIFFLVPNAPVGNAYKSLHVRSA